MRVEGRYFRLLGVAGSELRDALEGGLLGATEATLFVRGVARETRLAEMDKERSGAGRAFHLSMASLMLKGTRYRFFHSACTPTRCMLSASSSSTKPAMPSARDKEKSKRTYTRDIDLPLVLPAVSELPLQPDGVPRPKVRRAES
jgi:hypothetical protein